MKCFLPLHKRFVRNVALIGGSVIIADGLGGAAQTEKDEKNMDEGMLLQNPFFLLLVSVS